MGCTLAFFFYTGVSPARLQQQQEKHRRLIINYAAPASRAKKKKAKKNAQLIFLGVLSRNGCGANAPHWQGVIRGRKIRQGRSRQRRPFSRRKGPTAAVENQKKKKKKKNPTVVLLFIYLQNKNQYSIHRLTLIWPRHHRRRRRRVTIRRKQQILTEDIEKNRQPTEIARERKPKTADVYSCHAEQPVGRMDDGMRSFPRRRPVRHGIEFEADPILLCCQCIVRWTSIASTRRRRQTAVKKKQQQKTKKQKQNADRYLLSQTSSSK